MIVVVCTALPFLQHTNSLNSFALLFECIVVYLPFDAVPKRAIASFYMLYASVQSFLKVRVMARIQSLSRIQSIVAVRFFIPHMFIYLNNEGFF